MLNAKDLSQIAERGISEEKINEQLACFEKGFPFLEIEASASVEKGIMAIAQETEKVSFGLGCLFDKRQTHFEVCSCFRRSKQNVQESILLPVCRV